MKRFLFIILVVMWQATSIGQSVYMHEAQEDALEQEEENGPFSGIFSLVLFFGAVYVFSMIYDSHKKDKEKRAEIKQRMEVAESISHKVLSSNINISKYQSKEAWQKGYKKATYDRMYGKLRALHGKTIDDLIADYRHQCELGHLTQADRIMEEIGYFQNIQSQKK